MAHINKPVDYRNVWVISAPDEKKHVSEQKPTCFIVGLGKHQFAQFHRGTICEIAKRRGLIIPPLATVERLEPYQTANWWWWTFHYQEVTAVHITKENVYEAEK